MLTATESRMPQDCTLSPDKLHTAAVLQTSETIAVPADGVSGMVSGAAGVCICYDATCTLSKYCECHA